MFKPIIVDELEVMLQFARSLSFEQRIPFDKLIKFCKEVKRSNQGATIAIKPPQMIIKGKNKQTNIHIFFFIVSIFSLFKGNGGTGKSYLIRVICKWCEKILQKPGDLRPKVLRLSYAAVAASLIGNFRFRN